MKTGALVVTLLVVPMLVLSAWVLTGSQGAVEPQDSTILAEPPEYVLGYGFDPLTQTMEDTNGFRYSYQPDGIVQLDLPWGYTTYFSFGLTADYLGSPEMRTALNYTWAWDTVIGEALNETGNLTGYDYAFTATSDGGNMDWEICLEFSPTSRMKVTHTLTNGYAQDLTNVNFWYLFDLRGTATPYTIETNAGIVEGPLYQEIPDDIYWVRLGNQFQFDWRDALVDYENGHAYIGDGSVIGLDGLPILGISIELGDIEPGGTIILDPYFSGVERTWTAAADGIASNPARWTPVGVPATGDNITFDGSSTFNCNWNVEVTLGNFSMLTGYTGTVTPTVSFGCVDYLIASGTYAGNQAKNLTCEGNYSRTGGTVTNHYTRLIMVGDGTSISSASTHFFGTVTISANVSWQSSTLWVSGILYIGNDNTLTIETDKILNLQLYLFTKSYTNLGTIEGAGTGYLFWSLFDKDFVVDFGTISCPLTLNVAGNAPTNRYFELDTNASFGSSLSIYSSHASYLCTFTHGVNHTLSVTGAVTLGNRAVITQGTGAWSFESYSQTGVSSVFNQGAELVIGDSFTVSDGIFHALGDMTVPGDWDTATGSYLNDDNAVYLTGASNTLAMHADDSFFNVTVSGSYTMDTDTTVRLRATITGELLGTGDFKEPLPEFTSEGWKHACPMELYEYEVTQTYWDTLAIYDGPYWLHVVDGLITGVPNDNDTGVHLISLTLTWNDMTVYQNYTLIVCPDLLSESDQIILGVVLSLVMGFGLLGLAVWRNAPQLMVFSGLVFMFSAVAVYKDINLGWTMLSMGLGMLFLYSGGLQYANESES